jgi:DNA-binding NarL/FixJ family response regulator
MPLIVLVADDNLGTRLSVSDYLEMSGYSVIAAEDGQQALSMIETYHPHILVTDINMPRMDGYELVFKVRQHPSFRWLPVVFLTERNSTEARIRGYQTGCDVYLPKPFEMQELGVVIRNLLERQYDWRFFAGDRSGLPHPDLPMPPDRIPDWESPSKQDKNQAEGTDSQGNAIKLTEKEKEVLRLLVTKGLSNVDIGKILHRSSRTIEKHVTSLLRKTETSNRAELVRFALENHLLD